MEFIIGNSYRWDQIVTLGHESHIKEYGPAFLGDQAIHIAENNLDYWFILDAATGEEYLYKLVYMQ